MIFMSIVYFPKSKRKTPEEFQSSYEKQFREECHFILSIVLTLPAALVGLMLAICRWLSPNFTLLDIYVVSVTVFFYAAFVAVGWFSFKPYFKTVFTFSFKPTGMLRL